MNRRLKAFGLCLLALCGLTALMATSAQANWLVGGAELTTENKNVLAKAHTTGKLIVSSLNFEIRCTTVEGKGLKIVKSSTKGEGKAAFSGCTAFQISDGKEQKNCKPKEPILAGGIVLLKPYALAKGAPLFSIVLFEPETEGGKFTTVELPELCALAETSDVTGTVAAACGQLKESKFASEDCNVASVSHLLLPVVTLWLGKNDEVQVKEKMKFGENEATLEGIAAVELESKESWAGDV